MAISRRATIVGLNYYKDITNLYGCVNDAYNVKSVLDRHGNGTKNFDVELIIANDHTSALDRKTLKDEVKELFARKYEIALFYFAGHGFIESTGGFLLTSECKHGDDGLSMVELLKMVNESESTNKIIMLDCCHAGVMGNQDAKDDRAVLNRKSAQTRPPFPC